MEEGEEGPERTVASPSRVVLLLLTQDSRKPPNRI